MSADTASIASSWSAVSRYGNERCSSSSQSESASNAWPLRALRSA